MAPGFDNFTTAIEALLYLKLALKGTHDLSEKLQKICEFIWGKTKIKITFTPKDFQKYAEIEFTVTENLEGKEEKKKFKVIQNSGHASIEIK